MSQAHFKIIGNTLNALSFVAPKLASDKALQLFSTPQKGRVSEKQKPFLNTATQLQLNYNNDIDIATYHWKGSGKTILLVHGWESNTHRWEALISDLQKQNYNIVALDAPAHGASSGKLFNAILYSECINIVVNHYKPQMIIGHSVGGMATGFFQNKYQNKNLEKLILLGAPSEFTGVFKRYVDMMDYNERIENGLNAIVLKRFGNLPPYYSLAEFSKSIQTETLLIHDKGDKIIPFSDALLIEKNHPNAKLIKTTGFGHGLRNELVNNHILDFIAS